MLLALKRPFIWLYRFRHRCGYGVHSPFAFNLITHVIYETTPYYKYKELASEQKRLMPQKDRAWGYESLKVKRLLFRLVNYAQPATIVDAGMQAAQTSVFVIEGIRYTSRMRAVWKRISRHEKAGITFDLYDLGIIFFDKTRIKQDYIVNF